MAIAQTVPLLMLVNELKKLKAESGINDAIAAKHLGCAPSKINRLMLMQSKVTPGDAKLLGELYGASDELIDVLVDLARNLGQKGDWTDYRSVYRASFQMLLDLEHHSSRVRQVQSEIVPGLLQSDGYLRALNETPTPFNTKPATDELLKARRNRQAILTRSNPTTASFVLSESCLRRIYGSRAVMREQLQHLMETASLPNVQLQVLPFDNTNLVRYVSQNFELLHIPGPGIASALNFVHLEQYDDARYVDDHERVEFYEQLWGYLQASALGPVDSVAFIQTIADGYE